MLILKFYSVVKVSTNIMGGWEPEQLTSKTPDLWVAV